MDLSPFKREVFMKKNCKNQIKNNNNKKKSKYKG